MFTELLSAKHCVGLLGECKEGGKNLVLDGEQLTISFNEISASVTFPI